MSTAVPITLYLAQAIGLYLVLTGLSALTAPDRWRGAVDDLAGSSGLTLIAGVMVFALGVAMLGVHAIYTDPLAIVVTAVGWILLIEGALLILVPQALIEIGRRSVGLIRVWGVVAIVLGFLIGIAGLTGRADATAFL